MLLGALRHREQSFRIEGAGPALTALATLTTLVLVMPAFTVSAPGPRYTVPQLGFVAFSSDDVVRVHVLPDRPAPRLLPAADRCFRRDRTCGAANPRAGLGSFALLLVSLVAVVGLAKVLSPSIEAAVRNAGAPPAVIGIAIALLVLMPEAIAAIRAALADRLQTSLNLALGSGLATIGLTIPVVVLVCVLFDMPIVLGLEPKDIALLALTFLVVRNRGRRGGRTNMMQGVVQLVIFAAFLFLAVVP